MAKTSMKIKQQRPQKYKVREYTRCERCGRPHSVLSKYKVCRICFRELAYKGQIPGVKKASLIMSIPLFSPARTAIKHSVSCPSK